MIKYENLRGIIWSGLVCRYCAYQLWKFIFGQYSL